VDDRADGSGVIALCRHATLDVSAASGLVALGDTLYVVADDECFLACYATDGTPRTRVSLFEDVLPELHAERKRRKPDLEALTLLPDGRLLALGSGSTARRCRGALIDPQSHAVQVIDLAPLYEHLSLRVAELNIEGAAVGDGRLWLAQRGNGPSAQEALIDLDLSETLRWITREARVPASALGTIRNMTLGEIEGVRLSITDLAPHPEGGLLFCAAAEASDSTYLDGDCVGAALGRLTTDGDVACWERVDTRCKLEGLAVRRVHPDGRVDVWLVADPDAREQRAPLYTATLPPLPA
jgi:hypothetical protein